jgi:hypothetical protein
MTITVMHWTQRGTCDVGRDKTTVTIVTDFVTCAITLDGRLSRRHAIGKVADLLQREGRWSPAFLHAVRTTH